MLDISAVILAGGKNSRMKYKNKSFLKYAGTFFIERILRELQSFREKIIVSNNPSQYEYLGVKVVKDIIPGHGPLSGIHSGLVHSQYDYSLIVACDMPFLNRSLLEYLGQLAEGYDIVVPRTNGYLQPLCAVYSKACIPSIEKYMEKNIHKIIEFYPEVKVRYAEDEELEKFTDYNKIFKNINTPFDYERFCKKNWRDEK